MDLERFKWAEPSGLEDFKKLCEEAMRACEESDWALIGRLPVGIFFWAQTMRGFENWLIDLVLNREFTEAFHERLLEIWLAATDNVLEAVDGNVDILMTADDFAFRISQSSVERCFTRYLSRF